MTELRPDQLTVMDNTHADSANSIAQLRINDQWVTLPKVDPNQSLLSFIRDDLQLPGTKEGCASGDCGACTVIMGDSNGDNLTTTNSCITPVGHALGRQVITVEGLGDTNSLHPVQHAMVVNHGSQCGFCTPGFVMSMVGRQLASATPQDLAQLSRFQLVQSISGNLCRCTGYRPILAAAAQANQTVAQQGSATANIPALATTEPQRTSAVSANYQKPNNEAELQQALRQRASAGFDQKTWPLLAGSTDLWLEVSQRYQDFHGFIDISGVSELRQISANDNRLRIGASVTNAELEAFFGQSGQACTDIVKLLQRFGSPQIRNRGTIGGNIANASPIADWPPILLVLDAVLVLEDANGASRQVPLANFYHGYKQTEMTANEYLAYIDIALPAPWLALQAYKISKREDDDISSTMGAFVIQTEQQRVSFCRIAYGGVAATPIRLLDIEQSLLGQRLDEPTIATALAQLHQSLAPISDVRASADYRRTVSVNLLRKALTHAANDNTDNKTNTLDEFLNS